MPLPPLPQGRLAGASPPAATVIDLYSPPPGAVASVVVSICNRGATTATIRLALTAGGAPAAGDWLEYDKALPGGEAMHVTGIVLAAPQMLAARSSSADVDFVVFGVTEEED